MYRLKMDVKHTLLIGNSPKNSEIFDQADLNVLKMRLKLISAWMAGFL